MPELTEGIVLKKDEVVGIEEREREGLSFGEYMVAGSVAGMVEHMAMFPVDTLKTRMQVISSDGTASSSLGRALMSILRKEGAIGLYRGMGAMGLGAGPAHAVYFSVYELCKDKISYGHAVGHATSGVIATIASDAVFTPMEVVKQRLQLRNSPYRGIVDCVLRTFREEGFRAFYASYPTTLLMNAPFTAVHFATYEAVKKLLNEPDVGEGDNEEGSVAVHVTAGGAAGALAAALTNPLDVVKTRLQCQGICGSARFNSGSISNVVRQIVVKEGARALLSGLKPRVLFHTPAAAICWTTYEATKSCFT